MAATAARSSRWWSRKRCSGRRFDFDAGPHDRSGQDAALIDRCSRPTVGEHDVDELVEAQHLALVPQAVDDFLQRLHQRLAGRPDLAHGRDDLAHAAGGDVERLGHVAIRRPRGQVEMRFEAEVGPHRVRFEAVLPLGLGHQQIDEPFHGKRADGFIGGVGSRERCLDRCVAESGTLPSVGFEDLAANAVADAFGGHQ